MKTKYRYINFEQDTMDPQEWVLRNSRSKDILGFVSYYKPWKQYVIEFPHSDDVFNNQCLKDIADFLEQLNKSQEIAK